MPSSWRASVFTSSGTQSTAPPTFSTPRTLSTTSGGVPSAKTAKRGGGGARHQCLLCARGRLPAGDAAGGMHCHVGNGSRSSPVDRGISAGAATIAVALLGSGAEGGNGQKFEQMMSPIQPESTSAGDEYLSALRDY